MSESLTNLLSQLDDLQRQAVDAIGSAADPKALDAARVAALGKKAPLAGMNRFLKDLSKEDKPAFGQRLNAIKKAIEAALAEKQESFEAAGVGPADGLDVTLPGIRSTVGRRHPLMQTAERVKDVMIGLGFSYDDYPEIETEHFNFDALNTPDWHPARDMHDTFYTPSGHVMRTHTSAFQTRAMRAMLAAGKQPPLRAITFGRCYRNDEVDATHMPVFHQLDAIAIDKHIGFADLKATLLKLAEALFGAGAELRFRPSYFPFTTPSAEVDVMTERGWMEILGAGMTRPEVLRHGGLDPDVYQGFAFGLGIDRIAMKRYGVADIRLLYENEDAFLRQF
ncbi:MAG: phenylalanine--tRNA ligase subunit alpha [Planctomycetota bacterium]